MESSPSRRRTWRWVSLFCLCTGLAAWALLGAGCSQNLSRGRRSEDSPVVRVRVLQNLDKVMITASEPPVAKAASDSVSHALNFPAGTPVPVTLVPGGWKIGTGMLGTGELIIEPSAEGSVAVNGTAYRGRYRLVPVGPGHFDVVNDVDVDGYLKSVVSKELLWNWQDEAYKAQAIVARTYALYEARTAKPGSAYDLQNDQRSQVYGGIPAETRKSRSAVDETAGVVVAYGDGGQERIFKAYFSSCCGGISQSAIDAFGDDYIPPLGDQNVKSLCSASPRFNWGPIVVRKDELTRRFRIFGQRKDRPEKKMEAVTRIDIQQTNRWGRPTRFIVTDVKGARFSWTSEEIRWAVNTDAAKETQLPSGFFKVINDADQVRFVEGHGFGHGVGMCQWCSEARAELGMRHEDIVLAAFQKARLIRAY